MRLTIAASAMILAMGICETNIKSIGLRLYRCISALRPSNIEILERRLIFIASGGIIVKELHFIVSHYPQMYHVIPLPYKVLVTLLERR